MFTTTVSNLSTITAALNAVLAQKAESTRALEIQAIYAAAGVSSDVAAEYVSVPLWQHFGYEEVRFGGDSGRPVLPNVMDYFKDGEVDEVSYMDNWNHAMEAARNEFGLPIGKGDVGFRQIAESRPFELGKHQWRLVDFLRAPTRRPENPYQFLIDPLRVKFTHDELALGDGTWAWVRPESIGYEGLAEGEEVMIQNRAFIWSEDGVCRKVYKGLIKVTRAIKYDYFAAPAGYGALYDAKYGDVIEIHPMVTTDEYSPKTGRVSDQRGSYDGVEGWFKAFRPGMTMKLSEQFDGARMILAGAPIGMLPLPERIRIARQALKAATTIPMGVRRKVAPGVDLVPFTFRAPKSFKGQFTEGRKYVISRDPALPDGTSSWSGVCVGFTKGNFFEVPTSASPAAKDASLGVWEQMGGDFDGDDAMVTPHHSDGGLILGFNDRSEDEQKALLEASGAAGRKGAGFKQDYKDGNTRWAYARIAVVMLGMYDFAARKALDEFSGMAGKLMAASMKPAIQWAVDRQKRNLTKPEIPTFASKQRGDYLMQFIKEVGNPVSDDHDDKTTMHYQWDLMLAQEATARMILEGDFKGNPEKKAAMSSNLRWALGIVDEIKKQSPLEVEDNTTGRMYPVVSRYPTKDILEYQAAKRTRFGIAEPSEELMELEALITKARKSGRSAAAQGAEMLVAQYVKELDSRDWVQALELSTQFSDPQLWIKAAPVGELSMFFFRTGGNPKHYRATHQLAGVIVEGQGKAFTTPMGYVISNTSKMMFAGMTLEAGQLTIKMEKSLDRSPVPTMGVTKRVVTNELVARVNGFEIVRIPGHINNAPKMINEMEAAAKQLASII